MSQTDTLPTFSELGLSAPVLEALDTIGYEMPSPIQAEMIPYVLEGRDVLGQAQTGTGKTAAFALPILSQIDLKLKTPQVLVLAPTRELAIQVAEAFQKYATKMKGFHVLPIYGGQDARGQIRQLERGVHVVVGTPGRVMDLIRRKSLKLDALKTLVLDEADEMLRMGFIDDVEWVMEQIPEQRQIALFSATMPTQIHKITQRYLNNPKEITIKVKTTTASTITQRYWMVSGHHKLDALTRILEAEPFDAMIIFVRTKNATTELAEKLEARGYSSAAINGDIAQNQREKTVDNLKRKKIDILIATDVAARGLDVPRISHVINYDVPYDTEAYVHRIGRTGRAGRQGDAILFVAPREKRMLQQIERATNQKIEMLEMPSTEVINNKRIARFTQNITDTLASEKLDFYSSILEKYSLEHNIPSIEIAAALAKMVQGDDPLLLSNQPEAQKSQRSDRDRGDRIERDGRGRDRDRGSRRDREERGERPERRPRNDRGRDRSDSHEKEEGMQTYRIEVGHDHGVKPGNIVGAIANEAGIDSKHMGRIQINDDYSTIDLPEGMPKDIFMDLKSVRVAGQKLNISVFGEESVTKKRETLKAKPRSENSDRKKPSDKRRKSPAHKPRRKKTD
ncbi:MAG: DEAD/DEAH box helicase [Gammaproteobacteria bacterium]|nr:DEAD/DEAH box helicase [Gammaproteobacteria bacterium]